MTVIVDLASWACILFGGFFAAAGGLGLLRLPDVYSRMHAAGMTDTLGAGLIVVGLMLQSGFTLVTIKLALILLFLLLTSPTSTYALANAALLAGVKPRLDERSEDQSP